ncbi:MAG: GNAT family N-acetyltransferase [Candidatus Marinimicrobia bacterium]|jgi:GNAT superfamily N-acetyltransferase|nr:GNAT family N-acetyltransferase [Candidatus Neomarinimicrobiota bacterium]
MIRPYHPDDQTDMLFMLRQFHSESSMSHVNFNPRRVSSLMRSSIDDPDTTFCYVCEIDGKVVGSLAAVVTPYFFGDDLISTDYWLYLYPEYRGRMYGVKLLKKYINWANIQGVKEVMLSPASGISMDRTEKILAKMGFQPSGIQMKMRGS